MEILILIIEFNLSVCFEFCNIKIERRSGVPLCSNLAGS